MTLTKLSEKSLSEEAGKIGLKRGRMELLTSLLGYQSLKAHSVRQQKNLEAEDRSARASLGWSDSLETTEPIEDGDSEMGDTILGDVNHPAPVVVQKAAGVLAPLAMTLLGASVPGAAIGGYILSQYFNNEEPASVIFSEDESVRISLPSPDFSVEPEVRIE